MGAGCCRGASYTPQSEAPPDAATSFSSTAAPPSPSAEAAHEATPPEGNSGPSMVANGANAPKDAGGVGISGPRGNAAKGGVRHAWARPGASPPPVPPVPGPGSAAANGSPRDYGTVENSTHQTPGKGVDGCDALDLQDVQTPQSLEESLLKLDAEAPRTVPRKPGGHGPRRAPRTFSLPSLQAMQTLEDIDERLRYVEERVHELAELVRGPPEGYPEGVGKIKTELAFLESEANRLESAGVDNVYTSELNSGKVCAKEAKRAQLARLEALFDCIDALFKAMQDKA